jgi:predicted transglutaminase-like cysteine proteinase
MKKQGGDQADRATGCSSMIKKLIISAVVLTALIAAKESHAVGGFARALASAPAVHVQLAQNPVEDQGMAGEDNLSHDQRQELLRVNTAVNATLSGLDDYLGGFDHIAGADLGSKTCLDCADIKRDALRAKGWSADRLRIAYAVNDEGSIERVLVVSSADGEIVLGNGGAVADLAPPVRVPAAIPALAPVSFDI